MFPIPEEGGFLYRVDCIGVSVCRQGRSMQRACATLLVEEQKQGKNHGKQGRGAQEDPSPSGSEADVVLNHIVPAVLLRASYAIELSCSAIKVFALSRRLP